MKTYNQQLAGEQLRLARLAHGFSFEQVGEAVGVTRQFIQQLETGAKSASSEMIEALADALGVQKRFICFPFRSVVSADQCHFRKQLTTPLTVTNQVLARGTILDKVAEFLDSRLELPTVDFPQINVITNEDIEAATLAVRRHWRLGDVSPINSMMRVVENAGAIVTYFADLSERIDAFSMDRRRPIIVRSSLKESLCRQRFDLAHEAGHLIMHSGVPTGDRATESQAHRFASAFLMPRDAMLREFPRGNRLDWIQLRAMKVRWKVSLRALVRRGYDLNILSPAQYKVANIALSRNGQAKVEIYDNEWLVEQPELLDVALNAMSQVDILGERAVAEYVGLDKVMYGLIVGRPLQDPHPFDDEDGNLVHLRLHN